MPRAATGELARRGEDAALAHAVGAGARLIARNWRGAGGEMDLVLEEGEVLAFAEVKTRASRSCGTPAEAVDERKARRLTRVALAYLRYRGFSLDRSCRFDVFAVDASGGELRVEWIKGAFDAVE